MQRIAQIIGRMDAAGVESVVFNYYKNIDRSQWQFDFYYQTDSSVEPPEDIVALGARFIPIPPYSHLPAYIVTLYRHFSREKYTIVHSHMNTLSVFPLFAAWLGGVPVRIAHSHSTAAKGETKRNIFKYLLRPFAKVFPNHLLTCSELAGRWLFGNRTYEKGRVLLMKNAVDQQRFGFDAALREQYRRELGLGDMLVFGHVGRFMFQKNHRFLLGVFSEILKLRPHAVLLLIGDGPLRQEMEAYAEKLEINASVRFLGVCRDVAGLYQTMDLFLLPSHYEGLSVVSVEAMTAGLPILASDAIALAYEPAPSEPFRQLPLGESVSFWAKTAVEMAEGDIDRAQGKLLVEKAGYDIRSQGKLLGDYYERAMNKAMKSLR